MYGLFFNCELLLCCCCCCVVVVVDVLDIPLFQDWKRKSFGPILSLLSDRSHNYSYPATCEVLGLIRSHACGKGLKI